MTNLVITDVLNRHIVPAGHIGRAPATSARREDRMWKNCGRYVQILLTT
jgi:hypothetical protein